jgi:hypothetical protein
LLLLDEIFKIITYKGIKDYRKRHKKNKSNNDILRGIYKLSDVIRE